MQLLDSTCAFCYCVLMVVGYLKRLFWSSAQVIIGPGEPPSQIYCRCQSNRKRREAQLLVVYDQCDQFGRPRGWISDDGPCERCVPYTQYTIEIKMEFLNWFKTPPVGCALFKETMATAARRSHTFGKMAKGPCGVAPVLASRLNGSMQHTTGHNRTDDGSCVAELWQLLLDCNKTVHTIRLIGTLQN